MRPTNVLFILADEHSRDVLGCSGDPVVDTPNLDALAARGTRFTSAYTTSPICVPARASLATGRYVHEIGAWDNAFPYDGGVPSWHHHLRDRGHRVDSIGKLHFRSAEDDNGFSHEFDPLHVVEGVGDIQGAIRDDAPMRRKRPGIEEAGPGDSSYHRYDERNADRACRWLEDHARDEKPWALFLSFVCPHPPYLAPPRLYRRYADADLPWPPQSDPDDWPDHPVMSHFRRFFDFDRPFDETTRKRLLAAYYGVVTHLDTQIGRVLQALEATGMAGRTRVVYTSDHGDSLGARGLFGKFTMYDESAAIPLLAAGPGVPEGALVRTPVSLVDLVPTVVEAVGAPAMAGLPGRSLWPLAASPDVDRIVFAEYHAVGSTNASYMLRDARHKYVHHVGAPPQLFDMQSDPQELDDLAVRAEHRELLRTFESRLRTMLDPEAVNDRAKGDQRSKVEAFGGREAVLRRGTFENSPVPGERVRFN
jgi:choline-sulfatase